MILKAKEFQSACKSILGAVDTTTHSMINESLELKVEGKVLHLFVTNKEYFVDVKLDVQSENDFVATVDAKLFLSLIDKITTDELEITTKDNSLIIKGNGSYKLPMFYNDDKLLELTPITIDNPTTDFIMSSDILLSIFTHNSNTLLTGVATKPVHNMYYLDEQGCITYRAGACVNTFTLPQPVKALLGTKLVKLFRLFTKGTDVHFTLGYDEVNGVTQEKVKFVSDNVEITSILNSDESLLVSVPVSAIRGRANNSYPYSINISKDALIQAIDRLLLFASSTNGTAKDDATFEFSNDTLTIFAMDNENREFIPYNNTTIDGTYKTMYNIVELKTVLDGCKEQYITLHFGDEKALVVSRGTIKSVLPEVHLV